MAAAIMGAERTRVRGAAAAKEAGRWAEIPARVKPRTGAQTGRHPKEKAAACAAQATSKPASAKGRVTMVRDMSWICSGVDRKFGLVRPILSI